MEFNYKKANFSPTALVTAYRLAAACGHPQKAFKTIHVAGTNGKGSVSLKIASCFPDLKVGLFTSPHLFSFCERISISGKPIPETVAREGLETLLKLDSDACFFELTTLLALNYFRQEGVDLAVIETGIGGMYDPTNIISPIVSVITSISYDHTAVLGTTLHKIAAQKAGIIKPYTPIVLGPKARFPVILGRALELKAPIVQTPSIDYPFYDLENQATAKAALEATKLPYDPKGLQYRPSCRFEIQGNAILDVAHNMDGIERLIQAIEFHFPGQAWDCVVGLCEDKDIHQILKRLSQKADHLYLITPKTSRAASQEALGEILRKMNYHSFTLGMPETLPKEKLIVFCGSFYIMQEARSKIAQDQALLKL